MPKYIYTDLHSDYAYGLSAAVVIKGKKVDDKDAEDAVVARVVLSKKGDIATFWEDNAARYEANVLDAVKDAKRSLRELWESRSEL